MKGNRLPDSANGEIPPLQPGDYIKLTGGPWVNKEGKPQWIAKSPNGHTCALGKHDVQEHEDGTATFSPSILISAHTEADKPGEVREVWHGYLKRGVWEAC